MYAGRAQQACTPALGRKGTTPVLTCCLSRMCPCGCWVCAAPPAEYVQRYANPNRPPSSKASDDGSDKMEEDGQQGAEEDDSDDGFLSSSEEEEQ